MAKPKKNTTNKKSRVIHPRDLPLSCPTADMPLWSTHPKVYLPIEKTGVETCPYCGTHFVLKND